MTSLVYSPFSYSDVLASFLAGNWRANLALLLAGDADRSSALQDDAAGPADHCVSHDSSVHEPGGYGAGHPLNVEVKEEGVWDSEMYPCVDPNEGCLVLMPRRLTA